MKTTDSELVERPDETLELSFDKIDQWVRQKYCIVCDVRNIALEFQKASQEFSKNATKVFRQLITVNPIPINNLEDAERLFTTIRTIVSAGGRVIVVVGV